MKSGEASFWKPEEDMSATSEVGQAVLLICPQKAKLARSALRKRTDKTKISMESS